MNLPEPFTFLILALAVYRLSLLVSKESGPMRIFRKLRAAPAPKSSLKEGLSCQLCTSIWLAIPVSLYFCTRSHLADWVVLGGDWFILMLALSAVAIVVHMHSTKGL